MDEMTEADKAAFAKPETKTITDEVHGIAVDRLRSIIERIERLEEEKKALSSDIKDIMAACSLRGAWKHRRGRSWRGFSRSICKHLVCS
jgi:hypothetical protein